jgi:hypothetical protein
LVPMELPLGEFVRHQIVARPVGKIRARGKEWAMAEWTRLQHEAGTLMQKQDTRGALRLLRRAMTLAEQALEDGIMLPGRRARTCATLSRVFGMLRQPVQAEEWRHTALAMLAADGDAASSALLRK